jgi:hypothetical protein
LCQNGQSADRFIPLRATRESASSSPYLLSAAIAAPALTLAFASADPTSPEEQALTVLSLHFDRLNGTPEIGHKSKGFDADFEQRGCFGY